MREIKFRGFDFSKKTMIPFEKIRPMSYTYDVCLDEMLEGMQNHLKLMQYTGLKDKNSIEIYEGDVIELYLDEKYISNYICEFKDGCFMFREIGNDWIGTITDTELEVIGNIYENKELLN